MSTQPDVRTLKALIAAIHCRLTIMGNIDEAARRAIIEEIEKDLPELKQVREQIHSENKRR